MSVEALKSISVTNLDSVPVAANQTGKGARGTDLNVDDYVTISAAASVGSTYRILRLRSNDMLKSLVAEWDAMGAGKVNLSVYYSDSVNDGTAYANQGVIVPTTGDQFFASDLDLSAAGAPQGVLNESGNNPIANRYKQFWDALGLASNPGGYFDIVAVVHTTAITTGAGKLRLRAELNQY